MKRRTEQGRWIALLTCCILPFVVPVAAVDPPGLAWNVTLGGSGSDSASAVQQTSDGGYFVAGKTRSSQSGDVGFNHGGDDVWVVKLDGAGQKVWSRTLGGSGSDSASAAQQTSDGGYILAGKTDSSDGDVGFNRGKSDFWVVKLDGAGTIVWSRTLGGSGSDSASAVQETSDGGYIVAGSTSSNDGDVTGNHGLTDYWVVKLDGIGTIVWSRTLGGSSVDAPHAMQQTSDGGYIVAGETLSNNGDVSFNHGYYDAWVVKLDGMGQKVWSRCLGGKGGDLARAVRQTSDGGYIVGGQTDSNDGDVGVNRGSIDCWVLKLDGAGQRVWSRSLGGSGVETASGVQETTDGGYIVAGYTSSNDGDVGFYHGAYDCWVLKLDGTGANAWNTTLGGSGFDAAYAVQQTSDGGYIVGGTTQSSQSGDVGLNHGGDDVWVVKLDAAALRVLAVPPSALLPTDTDGDRLYDDVNGNGRKDFADLVLYFNQMTWIAANEPVAAFDYNRNGRIDFADVVWLFSRL